MNAPVFLFNETDFSGGTIASILLPFTVNDPPTPAVTAEMVDDWLNTAIADSVVVGVNTETVGVKFTTNPDG